MKLHCIGSLMALSLPWGSVMAFSLRWAGRGLYQYLYGVPWHLYGFITAMEALYDFITAMGALYGFITHIVGHLWIFHYYGIHTFFNKYFLGYIWRYIFC